MTLPDERNESGRPLTPEADLLLFRARQAVPTAEQLLADDDRVGAARRAYHAMADGIAALLWEEHGQRTRTAIALHAAVWSCFIRTGRLDPELHECLLEAFAASGHDGAEAPPAHMPEDIARLIERARAHVEAAHGALGQRPPWPPA